MRRAIRLGVAATIVLLAAPLAAQQPRRPAQPQPPAAPQPETPAPYEPQLLRLAEIIGALAWLRDLCGQKDGDAWRERMAGLVATEGTTAQRRERLAGAYNRGFRSYAQTHRRCSESASLTMQRFVAEGAKLTRELANRFSG